MAQLFYCEFTINGSALTGDVSNSTMGGVDVSADHIEGYELHFGSRQAAKEAGSARAGRRTIDPVRIRKPTDRTTPLLYRALVMNQVLDGTIKLFDTNPDSGETRHRFSIQLSNARISAVATTSPDVHDPANNPRPIFEWVEITAPTVAYTDEVNSVEFEDSVAVTR